MERDLKLLVLVAVAGLWSACPASKPSEERAVIAAPAPPQPRVEEAPVVPAAKAGEGGGAIDVAACADLEELEPRVGDGALTRGELACLRARLPGASTDSERYMVVYLLALDLDGKGYREDSAAVLREQLPRVDCEKVESRLRSACVAYKSSIR